MGYWTDNANKIQDKLKDLFEEENTYQERQQTNLKIRLTKLNDEKKRIFRQMATGEINDKDTYIEVKNDIQNEIFELQTQLNKIGQSSVDWLEQSSNLIYLAKNAGKLFIEGTKEEKQTLINCVSSNLFLKNRNVEFSLKQPFDILAEGHLSTTVLERWYEFGRIDWVGELEYPEWTVKEVGRFLTS